MKITPTQLSRTESLKSVARAKKSQSAFSSHLEAASTSATSQVAATSSLSALLSVQEVGDEGRKKVMVYGQFLLDDLEEVRLKILSGELSKEQLERLKKSLQQRKNQNLETTDPHLHAIIEEIEMRAAIELAKMEMAAR